MNKCNFFETNLNVDEENKNYHNFVYLLNERDNASSEYINNYYCIKKISFDKELCKNIDINIQLHKLKNVLFSSLQLIDYLLEEEKSYEKHFVNNNFDENDVEQNFLSTLIKNKTKKKKTDNNKLYKTNIFTERKECNNYEHVQYDDILSGNNTYNNNDNTFYNTKINNNEANYNNSEEDNNNNININKLWDISIHEMNINLSRSSFSLTSDVIQNEEIRRDEDSNFFFFSYNIEKFKYYLNSIKQNEQVKIKLLIYKNEIIKQIYKFKLYNYIMKLLHKERINNFALYHNKQPLKCKSIDTSKGKNSINKISDIFNIFKKNVNHTINSCDEHNGND